MWAAKEKLTTVGGGDARAMVVRASSMSGDGLPVRFVGVWGSSVWEDEEKDDEDGNDDSDS